MPIQVIRSSGRLIAAAAVGFAAITTMVGCGGGSGGSSSSSTCSVGLAGNANINELSASDVHKLCDYTSCLFSNNQAAIKKVTCVTAGTVAGLMGSTCDSAYDQCMKGDSKDGTSSESCDPADASECKVTVDQLTTCLKDQLSQISSAADTLSCANADSAMTALASAPASCTVVSQNCKSMEMKTGG